MSTGVPTGVSLELDVMVARVVRAAVALPGATATTPPTGGYRCPGAGRSSGVRIGGPLAIVALVAVAGLLAYTVHRYQEHQKARLRAIAARHGLEVDVDRKKPPPLDFDLFDRGSGKRVSAHMWRTGEPDSVFQYQYTEKQGENSRTYRFTAALVEVPFTAPHLVISTEDWWSRVKRVVGMRDIEVESPDFNERYQVRCRDDRFAITLLDPAMIGWMLSPESGRGAVTFEFGGRWMLCHCDPLDPEQLPGMLTWAQSARGRLPAVLAEMYGA
jgi:hypothetical protein